MDQKNEYRKPKISMYLSNIILPLLTFLKPEKKNSNNSVNISFSPQAPLLLQNAIKHPSSSSHLINFHIRTGKRKKKSKIKYNLQKELELLSFRVLSKLQCGYQWFELTITLTMVVSLDLMAEALAVNNIARIINL